MPQLLDDHIVDQNNKIQELESRLKLIEKYIHFVNNDSVAFGTHNAYVLFHIEGYISITGYSQKENRIVSVKLDQIINQLL